MPFSMYGFPACDLRPGLTLQNADDSCGSSSSLRLKMAESSAHNLLIFSFIWTIVEFNLQFLFESPARTDVSVLRWCHLNVLDRKFST